MSWLLPTLGQHMLLLPIWRHQGQPTVPEVWGQDTSQAGLLRNTSHPFVFSAKEVKYFKKGFWGAVGVHRWDTQALGCLLVGVQALLTDQRHQWVLVPGPGTSQLVGHLPPQPTP